MIKIMESGIQPLERTSGVCPAKKLQRRLQDQRGEGKTDNGSLGGRENKNS